MSISQDFSHSKSTALIECIRANFPQELQALDQWVVWRYEKRPGQDKPTKVPYNPATGARADSTEPATWAPFGHACAAFNRGSWAGLGFVVTDDDPYVGIDIDHCIVNGQLSDNARRWIDLLSSYTEITPSQNGVRIWVRGVKLGPKCKNAKAGVEIYQAERFFTVTGNHFDGTPRTINSRQKALTALYRELFPEEQPASSTTPQPARDAIPHDDQELIQRMFAASKGGS